MTPVDTPRRRRPVMRLVYISLALLAGTSIALFGARSNLRAQSAATAVSYTEAQADQGRAVYAQQCASCHGANLDDGAYGPPLTGDDFRQKWGGRSLDALFTYTSERMPPAQPGTLGDATYAQVLALHPSGKRRQARARRAAGRPDGAGIDGAAAGPPPAAADSRLRPPIPPAPPRTNPLEACGRSPTAMLTKPPDGEWLLWRRTYDAYGFSPLKKINKSNVRRAACRRGAGRCPTDRTRRRRSSTTA